MIRIALRGLLTRKLRAVLTATAIVLGVAMVSGTFVLTDTINKSFNSLMASGRAGTSAVISAKSLVAKGSTNETPAVSASLLERVRSLSDVGQAYGVVKTETARMNDWLTNQEEDHFKLYGAFDGDRLAGFTGGALADPVDTDCGVELYYLFVDPEYRGQKLSLLLLARIIQAFQVYRFHELVVYNFAETASNAFYRRLGGTVRRSYVAEIKGAHCPVDVFAWDLGELARTVQEKLG